MTMTRLVLQKQHRRRVSAVHLAGSNIITWVHITLITVRREHSSNVLMHALQTPAVLLLIGSGMNAGYMRRIVHVIHVMTSRSLKSSDNVIYKQVRDVITCFTDFHCSYNCCIFICCIVFLLQVISHSAFSVSGSPILHCITYNI